MERLEFLIVFYITITLASLHAMFNWQLSSSSLPQMEVGKNPCTYPYCFSLALRWSIKYVGNLCTRNIEFVFRPLLKGWRCQGKKWGSHIVFRDLYEWPIGHLIILFLFLSSFWQPITYTLILLHMYTWIGLHDCSVLSTHNFSFFTCRNVEDYWWSLRFEIRWNMNGGSETNLGNSRKPQKVWVWRKIGQMLVFLL